MRIVSTFSTATEIICALGLGRQLVGVSHKCNFPSLVTTKPRVSSLDFDYQHATSAAIDVYVENKTRKQKSLYTFNEKLLHKLQPTHIVTQQLCDVCGITPSDIQRAIKDIPNSQEPA